MLWGFIWNFIQQNLVLTAVGAITLVQIAPIKINPWTHIGKCIRGFFCGDIEAKLDRIAGKVDQLEKQLDEDKAQQARRRILRFSDELYNGEKHSREFFDEIVADIDRYEEYCGLHPTYKNNKTAMSISLIKDTYSRLMSEHKFL